MHYSHVEQKILSCLHITDVGDDCVQLVRDELAQGLQVPASHITDTKLMEFVANLHQKLSEDGFIHVDRRTGIVDILVDIARFRLDSVEKILCYVIGQFRSVGDITKPIKTTQEAFL